MTSLDKFGQFVMRNLRDRGIEQHVKLQAGEWRAPAIQELQAAVAGLPEDTKRLLLRCIVDTIDTATHDFLFALQDSHDRQLGIEALVDGTNVAEISDGLQGEPYGNKGWIERYSEYAALRRDSSHC
jgi:hypothetical protein